MLMGQTKNWRVKVALNEASMLYLSASSQNNVRQYASSLVEENPSPVTVW